MVLDCHKSNTKVDSQRNNWEQCTKHMHKSIKVVKMESHKKARKEIHKNKKKQIGMTDLGANISVIFLDHLNC